MSRHIANSHNFLTIPSKFYSCRLYHNFDAMVPDEQEATMSPCSFKFGFSIFTIIHPRIPPNKKVSPMLTGINHLH